MNAALDSRTRALVAEATAWRLLGLLLEPPGPGWRERVLALAAETGDPGLRAAAEVAAAEASEGVYYSAFGPGGPASPREVSYSDTLEPGALLAELEAHYSAFAYQPRLSEPADHFAVEAGFFAYLRLKEAYASFSGESEHAALTAAAAERFLAEHVSPLATSLAAILDGSGIRYLKLVADVLRRYAQPAAPEPVPLNRQAHSS